MRKLLVFTMLIITFAALSASDAGRYLIKIDRSLVAVEQLPSGMNVYHVSRGFILSDADDIMLNSLPRGSYNLLDRFPLNDNWYLLTRLPDRDNPDSSNLGTMITGMDDVIVLKSIHSSMELASYTDMPYVRLDFTPIKLRTNPVLSTSQQTRVDFGNLLTQVNQDSIMWYIQRLQDFGTRNAAAPNRLQVAQWIRDQFIRFGITNAYLEQFFVQGIDQYNVVATIPGTIAPDKFIIVGGHHDSIISGGDTTVAPGADDNASGAVAAMEMARVMMANNYQPECSIRFVTFACEEYGLYGSKYHSQQALQQGQDIKLMMNHDMIGYSTANPSNWLVRLMPYDGFLNHTAFAMNVTDAQTTLSPYAGSLNSPSSDSHPFWQRGFPVIYFFEDQFNPYYHSVNDIVANMNPQYVKEVIKASTAVCVSFDQIPSPAWEINTADTGTGTSLQVSWQMQNPESDIVSYKVYVSDDIYVTPLEYTATQSPYILTGLTSGTEYWIGVAPTDSDGNTGLPIWTTAVPGLLPHTPVQFEDLPGFQIVQLQWQPNNELDLAGYNLYRSTSPDAGFILLNDTPITQTFYTDESVQQIIYYYYKLTAVDQTNLESIPTAVLRTRAVTLNQGILIIDETSSGSTVFTPGDLVSDQFYDDVLHSFQKSHFDTETDGSIKLADMGIYSSILWHGNDPGNLSYPFQHREELRKYTQAGGKVMITSYYPARAFDNNNSYPISYQSGDFMYDFFGVGDVTFSTNARFRYALPEDSGFPPLTVDSLKTVAPLLGHIYNIESIGANDLAYNVYYYGSDYQNTEPQGTMNGMAVGVYINETCGQSVLLSFPLYNMKQDEVTNLMYHVFHNLFGETVSVTDNTIPAVSGLALARVYPNPFSNFLSFEVVGVKAGQPLSVDIYNVKGQKVRSLYSSAAKTSSHNLSWDGKDEQGGNVTNSVYFIRAEQDGKAVTGKILKLK